MSGSGPVRVCLILEGTYPYVPGGVSGWTHELIQQLPEIEFVLLTLSPPGPKKQGYEPPPNVVGISDHVLQISGEELVSVEEYHAAERIELLHQMKGRATHRDVSELLEDLRTVAQLNPLAPGGSRRGSRRAMRGFWNQIMERYALRNPFYALGEFFWTWFNSRAMLLSLLRIEIPKADVYHTVCTGYAGFVGAIARATTGRPLVLTEHGIYHRERSIEIDASRELRGQQRDQWKQLFFALSRLSYAASDRVITLFEANRRLELALGAPPSISTVIPNGIDLPRFRGVVRQERPGFHVGLVGRVVPIKDIKTFIVAARGVIEQVPDAEFHCIGPDEESPEYVQECRDLVKALGIEQSFHFTGRQNVLEYYAFLDVVVLSSLSEAQPLVILEALAAGVPVVATRVGDVSGLLDNQDRFIALPKDAEGLVSRIVAIQRDPESAAAWIAERESVLDSVYDRKVIYSRYGSLYQELAQSQESAWPA